MAKAWRAAAVAAAIASCLAASPGAAVELSPSIDLDYTYEQDNLGGAVTATTSYRQTYEMKYETSLTSALDFMATVKLELEDKWDLQAATTSRLAPTLELEARGDQLAAKFSYTGSISTTEQFEEDPESEQYSNSADLEVELTPDFWPELRLKLQEKRDYELQRDDATGRSAELTLRDEIFGLVMEYRVRLAEDDTLLPQRTHSESTDWSLKSTYKQQLLEGTDFEISHEIEQSFSEDTERGVFAGLEELSSQSLKARVRSVHNLTERLNLLLALEYEVDQDLLELEFDYELAGKYSAELRYDMFRALKLTAGAKRETKLTEPMKGEDRESEVKDSVKAGFDFAPVEWLRLSGKAEFESEEAIEGGSGGSVDTTDEESYELGLKNKFGEFWELTVNGSYTASTVNGRPELEEGKFKASLKLKYGDLVVEPVYEGARDVSWEDVGDPVSEGSLNEIKIKIDYKIQLLDLLVATFSHEYGTKITREYDEVQNFERELTMNEGTRLNLALADVVEGLRIEGEVERKGSDTEDDEDVELVEISYTLKLDWEVRDLTLGSSVQYHDKGDDFDDLTVSTRVAWKTDTFGVSGEYQFGKSYAEETDEERKLNLKLFYTF